MDFIMCPNCDAAWGIEEIDFQECDCCGYPDNEDDEGGDEDYYEIDDEGW